LLRVAEAVLADQDGDGAGAGDSVLERRDPSQARMKFFAVKKRAQTQRAEPAVHFRGAGEVAAGVA
jgi:hypothetical protein